MMLIKIALIISVILQAGAAIIAVGLIRRTRYNISWILISLAFVFMALRRIYDLFQVINSSNLNELTPLNSWAGVIISLLIFIGTIFIRRIFDVQNQLDNLKNAQEKRILKAMIDTEEKDKRAFARNLHDGLGPLLSSTKMMLSTLYDKNPTKETERIIARSEKSLDEAIVSLKQISNLMSPHVLESYGLISAVDRIIGQYNNTNKVQILLQENIGTKRLNIEVELASYRIICELLHNTMQHADASEVSIHILLTGKDLQIIYSDNGKGFDTEKVTQGMGLSNIESRVKSLDGEITIHSKPDKGFFADIKIRAL